MFGEWDSTKKDHIEGKKQRIKTNEFFADCNTEREQNSSKIVLKQDATVGCTVFFVKKKKNIMICFTVC